MEAFIIYSDGFMVRFHSSLVKSDAHIASLFRELRVLWGIEAPCPPSEMSCCYNTAAARFYYKWCV